MWQKLDSRKKHLAFAGAIIVILYITYSFSFRHTVDAIILNHELKTAQLNNQITDGSFPQLKRKNDFYVTALKGYKVKKDDRENRLWQALSGMALANDTEIGFNAGTNLPADTLAVQNGIVDQQFHFKGNYFNLVKLLDTVSSSSGIGKISEFRLTSKPENTSVNDTDKLTLKLTLTAIAK